jgi:hypothetical protein
MKGNQSLEVLFRSLVLARRQQRHRLRLLRNQKEPMQQQQELQLR